MTAAADLLARRAPTELVPGDADAADSFAVTLRQHGERFGWAATDYRSVKVDWTGEAADAYRASATTNAVAWEHAADCFVRAATAMAAYADALREARSAAATASLDFEEGMAAADQWARREYDERTSVLEDTPLEHAIPPYVTPPRVILAALPGGRSLRQRAVAALEGAWATLVSAGDAAATTLRSVTEGYTSGPPYGMTPGTEGNPSGKGEHVPINGPVPTGDDDFDLTRIRQGQIGDCWFVSALGVLGQADPQWLRDHMVLNPDGSYTVTFYQKNDPFFGDPTYAPVTITVPASVISDGVRDSKTGEPSWASIYEKAAAVFFGGDYDDINGGYGNAALEALTGRSASIHNDYGLADIRDGLARGDVFVTSTETQGSWWPFDDEVDNRAIVPDHLYMIDAVKEVDGELQIHVVNPWGPDGGQYDGEQKYGDLWLTEEEFHQNFDHTSSVGRT